MKKFYILFPLLYLFSCQNEVLDKNGIPVIEVAQALENKSKINLSTLVSSLEYVRLETNANSLYRLPYVRDLIGDSLILFKTNKRISLFDRGTGGYIKDLGHVGDDPEGYKSNPRNLGINPFTNRVYASRNQEKLMGYSLKENDEIDFVKLPTIVNETGNNFTGGFITAFAYLDSTHFIAFVANMSGNEKNRILIHDRLGKVQKSYPNHLTFEKDPGFIQVSMTHFQEFNGRVLFKEAYNDTLFHISLEAMESAFVMNFDKYGIPYQDQEAIRGREALQEFLRLSHVMESDSFLFFEIEFKNNSYSGLFEKTTGETRISDSKALDYGYVNDIDGFVSFKPNFISRNGEIVSMVPAERIVDWFASHPDDIASLPANIQALQDVQPEDNFVVMIGKLIN